MSIELDSSWVRLLVEWDPFLGIPQNSTFLWKDDKAICEKLWADLGFFVNGMCYLGLVMNFTASTEIKTGLSIK